MRLRQCKQYAKGHAGVWNGFSGKVDQYHASINGGLLEHVFRHLSTCSSCGSVGSRQREDRGCRQLDKVAVKPSAWMTIA